ncbi:hypothetical protein KY311_02080 [Candidatus Woesearchaeota archaeon]|nr:hypothetical protein [Candidatus Woesearchaeota archaeon]
MKKIIVLAMMLLLVAVSVSAINVNRTMTVNTIAENGSRQVIVQRQVVKDGEVVVDSTRTYTMARNVSQLRDMIQERKREQQQEVQQIRAEKRELIQNANRVRLAVHALLAMENLTGGIGKNVSAIARDFNNSIMARMQLEEQIQNRSRFSRFFMGGDWDSAKQLQRDLNQTQLRLQRLEQLKENCTCSEDVKALMQEQIQLMHMERDRLRELSDDELGKKGMFGWLFRRR